MFVSVFLLVDSLKVNKNHIVIEGPIGVGKSSLCRRMLAECGGSLFLEKPVENPYLERFYRAPGQYSLQTQLFFLLQRVEQMTELRRDFDCKGQPIFADFMIEKDPIFAELTLNEEDLALYRQVYSSLKVEKTKPDIVVYLQAPVKVLQQRIKLRNNRFEQKIADSYLEKLSNAYTEYFHRYNDAALLIVNAAEFNPLKNDNHFQALMEQINRTEAGKHFFNPLAA